ncbi:hypothetical protein [Caballeronia sp. GACF4]|uniref:hypothetical protein n=1 Tax=Caballeronia sp. GACF4 TaxID=2921763 RepID=UPI00202985A2|nr:hypothetical protein [Caballeronia sp. GACF4]
MVQFDPVDKRVVLTPDFRDGGDTEQMGTLSHELSHFLDDPAERAFTKDYGVNPRDPDAYNQAATRYVRAQTVAEAKHNRKHNRKHSRKHSRKVARTRELPLTSRRRRLPMTQLKTLPRAMMPELAER